MRGIALHHAHQIGDQVIPLAQLCVDIGPALTAILAEAHQPVVDHDDD